MRHVGDGDPEGGPVVLGDEAHSIVEVFGVGWVDGDQRQMAEVRPAGSYLGVAINLCEPVSMVHQRGFVVTRKRVSLLATTPFEASIEQPSRRPSTGLHQQQRHGRLVLRKPKS